MLSAWLLALVPLGLLQLTHSDLHEHNELPPLLHWVRDASLAVPLAAVAIVATALLLAWLRPATPAGRRALATALLYAVLVALAFAVLSIPGSQFHSLLFGAEEEVGVSLAEDLLRDAGLTLLGGLAVMVPLALAIGLPWRGRLRRPRSSPASSVAGPR